ncbi:DinB superfamily protein [Planctomycetes bacterium MalM25]|nr:DinB superfamily protein [Planctomycetes bacterium MalM25]
MEGSHEAIWLQATIDTLRKNKALADSAIEQLSLEQLRVSLHPELNSIAVIMKHVAGNLRSRWTDFLEADGEKPERNRDGEFIDDYADRQAILDDWESGWATLFAALGRLTPADLGREVPIRGCPHPVPLAIQRSITHTSYHLGQIVQTARAVVGEGWRTLTIPRGKSEEYNRETWARG